MNFKKCVYGHYLLALALCSGIAASPVAVAAADEPAQNGDAASTASAVAAASSVAATSMTAAPAFARVNGKAITVREYAQLYNDTMRKRYYHAKPPESEELAARKEVADILIERELLIEEAERRGLKLDEARLAQAVENMDRRFAASEGWKAQRDRVLASLKEQLTRKSQFDQITEILHQVPESTPEDVRAYYEGHPDLFTEPEQLRLSVITLKVDPSSDGEVWMKARDKALALRERIVGGADFAELARQNSQDKSAGRGGDMGYLHGGMLPDALSKRVDSFKVGVVSEPVRMLEGISLFRVEDRVPAKLRNFEDVEQRVRALLKKEREENAWKDAVARLREAAKIEILIPLDR